MSLEGVKQKKMSKGSLLFCNIRTKTSIAGGFIRAGQFFHLWNVPNLYKPSGEQGFG